MIAARYPEDSSDASERKPASFRPKRLAKGLEGSPVKQKPAWVVADWKHRVPEGPLPVPTSSKVPRWSSAQRQRAHDLSKKQVEADYANVSEQIEGILQRCAKVQATYASPGKPRAAGLQGAPTSVSMRSSLLFEAPQQQPRQQQWGQLEQQQSEREGALQQWQPQLFRPASPIDAPPVKHKHLLHEQQQQRLEAGKDGQATAPPAGLAGTTVEQRPQQQQQQQQQPQKEAPLSSWRCPVDLNPGFSFRPGSPQRLAATCPQLPSVLAQLTSLLNNIEALDLTHLSHRELLQAGLQQLNGEFYRALSSSAVAAAAACRA